MRTQPQSLSFDPAQSRFVLIGTGRYTQDPKGLPQLPSAVNNLREFERILLDPEIVGVPHHCITIIQDPRDKADLSRQLFDAARSASDLLLIYYVGHGLLGYHTKQLYLAVEQTAEENVDFSGYPFDEIRILLDASSARQRLLILDCCFSGNALEGALGSIDGLIDSNITIKSTYTIASAPPNRLSIAEPGEKYTAFSAELFDLLAHGTGGPEKFIDADLLFDNLIKRIALKPKLPPPRRRDKYDGSRIVIARNRVGSQALETQITKVYQLVGERVDSLDQRINEVAAKFDERLNRLQEAPFDGSASHGHGGNETDHTRPRVASMRLFGALLRLALPNSTQEKGQERGPQLLPFRADVRWITMFIAFLVILWELYTIEASLAQVSNNWIGGIVSSAAIVAILGLTSWFLGGTLAGTVLNERQDAQRPRLRVAILAAVFVLAFTVSTFLTFSHYFSAVFNLSSKQLIAEQQPMQLASEVLPRMNTALDQALRANDDIVISAARSWLDDLRNLALFTEKKQNLAALAERLDQDRQAQAVAKIKRAQAERAIEEQIQLSSERARRRTDEVAELDKRIEQGELENRDLEKSARDEESRAHEEMAGVGSGRSGCGPLCRESQAKAADAKRRSLQADASLKAMKADRDSARKALDELRIQIAMLEQKAGSLASVGLTPVRREVSTGGLQSLTELLLKSYEAFLAGPSRDIIQQAKPACELMLEAARASATDLGLASDFTCAPKDERLAQLLSQREVARIARREFADQCGLGDSKLVSVLNSVAYDIRGGKDAPSEGLYRATKPVESCIAKAGNAGLSEVEMRAMFGLVRTFVRENTLDRNNFELAKGALLTFNTDSSVALIAAVGQGLLVFILALLSELLRQQPTRNTSTTVLLPSPTTPMKSSPSDC